MEQARRGDRRRLNAELLWAKRRWQPSKAALRRLKELLLQHHLSVASGEIVFLENTWYVSHSGLLRIAVRNHCAGIEVKPLTSWCDITARHWAFRATVYKSRACRGFVGYGDASPTNVSAAVRGAEMRVAETRAVNRALRKAYGIGICSVEELGSSVHPADLRPKNSTNGNGNYGGPKVRDRLCQLIRRHRLDANLVKCYAVEFCGTKTLREATREQVEAFVAHLAEWAQKDRNALLSQLNSYLPPQTETTEAGAA